MIQQFECNPRIFRRNEINFTQGLDCPRRKVGQVANGRSDDINNSGHKGVFLSVNKIVYG